MDLERRNRLCRCALVLTLLFTPSTRAAVQQDSDGLAVVEAEHADARLSTSTHEWSDVSAPGGFSGTAAVAALPDNRTSILSSNSSTGPRLDYLVHFQATGSHWLWVYGYGVSGGSNSAYAGINGSLNSRRINLPRKAWGWASIAIEVPATGEQSISIWMREDGSVIDKLLVTNEEDFVPVGLGPDQSPPPGPVLVATDDVYEVDPDSSANLFEVLENDSAAEGTLALQPLMSGAVTSAGGQLSLSLSPQGILYTPPAGFVGSDSFTYSVTDATNGEASALVTIMVGQPPITAFLFNADGQAVVEAESAVVANPGGLHDWTFVELGGDVGGTGYLLAAPERRFWVGTDIQLTSPSFSTEILFQQPGAHRIWVRGFGAGGGADSVHLGLDGDVIAPNVPLLRHAWGWSSADLDIADAGVHTVAVWMREDSARVDRLLVTADTAYEPNGIGPPESERASTGPTNRPPVANPDAVMVVNDGEPLAISPLENDTDADGDTLSIDALQTQAQSAQGGVISLSLADQQLNYLPPNGFEGDDSFVYGVTDGNGGLSTGLVTITVALQNSPPVAVSDTMTIEAGSGPVLLNVKLNDTDPNGDPLTIAPELTDGGSAQGGIVTIDEDTDQILYTAPDGFLGLDTLSYGINDGRGGESTALVNITVEPPNVPPVANADELQVERDAQPTTIFVLVNDNDPDGNDFLIDSAATPSSSNEGGTISVAADRLSLTYQPQIGYVGADQFDYFIIDSRGGTASATVTVVVDLPQLDPVAVDDDYAVAENSVDNALSVLENDTDENNDPLIIDQALTGVTSLAGASVVVDPSGLFLSYSAIAGYNGFDSFTYTVSDGTGRLASATVTVAVGKINVAPVASNDAVAISPNLSDVLVDVLGNDRDDNGDPLIIEPALTPAASDNGGAVAISSDQLTLRYTAPAEYVGIDTFSYGISDGDGGEDSGLVTVLIGAGGGRQVQEVSGLLSLEAEQAHSSANPQTSAWIVDTSFSSYSGDGYMVATPDSGVTVTSQVEQLSPVLNFEVFFLHSGEHKLWLRGHGPKGGSNSVFVGVDGVVQGEKIDTPAESWGWMAVPLMIDTAGPQQISVWMREDGTRVDKLVIHSDLQQIVSGIGPPASAEGNLPPSALADTLVVAQSAPPAELDVLLNDSDPNGDTLTIDPGATDSLSAQGAEVSVVNGRIRYAQDLVELSGPDTFSYVVVDGRGGSSTGLVTVQIIEPPQPVDDSFDVAADSGRIALDVLANDLPASAELAIDSLNTATSSVLSGLVLVDPVTQQLWYEAPAGGIGADSFTYGVIDPAGGRATAQVVITLTPETTTGAPPILEDIGNRSVEVDSEYVLHFGASNDDGLPPLFILPEDLPVGATFVDHGDGKATFEWDTTGQVPGTVVTLDVQVADAAGLTDSETITLTVIGAGTFSHFTQGDETARLYGLHEIEMVGNAEVENPFQTSASVTFTHSSGSPSVVVRAFFDGFPEGEPTWRARLYPEQTGQWTWSSASASDPLLNGLSGSFVVEGSELAGMLQVHIDNPRQWQTANGETFLNLSDTAYTLLNTDIPDEDFVQYVVDDVELGVTALRSGACGGYGRWHPNAVGNNWCWKGLDTSRYALDKFRHTDARLKWLLDNAPQIYMQFILFGNGADVGTRWESISQQDRNAMLDYQIARWGAWPQLYYLIINDTNYNGLPANQRMVREIGTYLTDNSTWPRFISSGPKRREDTPFVLPNDFATWHNYLHIERFSDIDGTTADMYAEFPVHTFHGEDWYEQFGNAPGDPLDPAYYYRRLFWATLLSGGSPNYGSRALVTHPYSTTALALMTIPRA